MRKKLRKLIPSKISSLNSSIQCLSIFGWHFGDLNKKWSVFGITTPSDDGKIQFMIENTMVRLFLQKVDECISVIFDKINSNTVI